MPLPAIGFFAWLLGLVTTAFTTFATWMIGRMVYEKAVHYALVTAFVVAASAMTLTISLTVKVAIIAAQINLPSPLNQVTYFLPHNINQIFAIIVTLRVSMTLYRWTVSVLAAYVPSNPKHGLLL